MASILKTHALIPTVLFAFFMSCQTLLRPKSQAPHNSQTTSKLAHVFEVKPLFFHIRAIDTAFLLGDCRQVNQLARAPKAPSQWPTLISQDLLPPLTEMAVKVCQAKALKTPWARAQALDAIAQAQKGLGPLVPAEAFGPLSMGLDLPTVAFWVPPRSPPPPSKSRTPSGDFLLHPEDQRVYAQARMAREKGNFTESLSLYTVLVETLKQRGSATDTLRAIAEERGQVLTQVESLYAQAEKSIVSREQNGQVGAALAQAQESLGQFPSDEYRARLMDHITRLQAAAAQQSPQPNDTASQGLTSEQWLERARGALSRMAPLEALEALSQIPARERSEAYMRLERDAIEMDIREKRYMVRQLYTQASQTTILAEKSKLLNACIRILRDLMSRYPKSPSYPSLERNLKSLQLEAKEVTSKLP